MRRNNSSLSTLSSGGGSSNNKKLLAKDWSLSTLGADGEIVPPKKRNPTAHKEELFRALSQYTGKKRSAAVANALSRAVDLQDMRDANGFSVLSKALLLAVEEDVLEMLVSFGAAVDTLEPGGLTPLHTLVKHQRPRELAVLLKLGANWRVLSRNDNALAYAIRRRPEILLGSAELEGSTNNTPGGGGGGGAGGGGGGGGEGGEEGDLNHFHAQRTRMIRALVLGCPEGPKAATRFQNPDGLTALHVAALVGDAEAAAFLLDEGQAFVDAPDRREHTPLWVAASKGQADVCAVLLDRGACVDAAGREKSTPLRVAARNGGVVDERRGSRGEGGASSQSQRSDPAYAKVVALLVARGASLSCASITAAEAVTTTRKVTRLLFTPPLNKKKENDPP